MRLVATLVLGLVACLSGATVPPVSEPAPPVETTGATMPLYRLASHPGLRVSVEAKPSTLYRATILGADPQTVELKLGNASPEPFDLSGAEVSFRVRRGAARIACASHDVVGSRETKLLLPGHRTTLTRETCSLPLPGKYEVEVLFALAGDARPERAGAYSFEVKGVGPNVPHAVESQPGLFAAMGGDTAGVRFTQSEWTSGAYHVVVRLTNAGTNPVHLPAPVQVVFRVTQHGRPLACTATHDLAVPREIASGESVTAPVPVTCVINVKGRYAIHASLATGDAETHLVDMSVEVTSNPLLYLPVIPWGTETRPPLLRF
jgi:hypothetical protein